MIRLFENDDVILDKDEKTNEYRLSFFKDGHYKSEEYYPSMDLLPAFIKELLNQLIDDSIIEE